MTVEIHELDADFLEGALGEQMTFDTGQRLVRIVVGLLDQSQFLTLRLIQTRLHAAETERKGVEENYFSVWIGIERLSICGFEQVNPSAQSTCSTVKEYHRYLRELYI